MNTLTAAQTTSTESTDLVEAPSTETVAEQTSTQVIPATGSKVLRFATRLTAPVRKERSLKKALGNALTGVICSGIILSATTVLQDVAQDFLDPRADQVAGSAQLSEVELENIRANTLMKHYECSTAGLAEGVIPAHALVRLAGDKEGRVTFVSFEEGWEIHMDDSRGELAAVCAK